MHAVFYIFFFVVLQSHSNAQAQFKTEKDIHTYFVTRMSNPEDGLDPIEGIWNLSVTSEMHCIIDNAKTGSHKEVGNESGKKDLPQEFRCAIIASF
jgi:hypothetical protein